MPKNGNGALWGIWPAGPRHEACCVGHPVTGLLHTRWPFAEIKALLHNGHGLGKGRRPIPRQDPKTPRNVTSWNHSHAVDGSPGEDPPSTRSGPRNSRFGDVPRNKPPRSRPLGLQRNTPKAVRADCTTPSTFSAVRKVLPTFCIRLRASPPRRATSAEPPNSSSTVSRVAEPSPRQVVASGQCRANTPSNRLTVRRWCARLTSLTHCATLLKHLLSTAALVAM